VVGHTSRSFGEWNDDDDFDVLADGAVVGPIFKSNAVPVGNRSRLVLIGYRLR
jgi:hypothetical protein